MRRREVVALLATGLAWPEAAFAQQRLPAIGFLNSASREGFEPYVAAFRDGLKEAGFVEGQNILVEYRWAEGHYDRLPSLVKDLMVQEVAVIAATSTPAALAAKAATTSIPIVFTTASNPLDLGLVASLSRPGGNVTGATQMNVEVAPKRLELLHELLPSVTAMALLINPANPYVEAVRRDTSAAADRLGINLEVLSASTEGEIEEAFATAARLGVGALVIGTDTFFTGRSEQLAALTLRYRLPSIYQYRAFAAAGGLLTYGGSIRFSYRTAGSLTGRVLKGEKPADLPVEQVAQIELVINLKTAKVLGLTFPITLLGRADEVIE